jgi:UDP-N-acetylmuramate dehydrogenase
VTLLLRKGKPEAPKYKSLADLLDRKKVKKPTLRQIREGVLALRKKNHIDPKIAGNAGSFFKNPVISNTLLKKLLVKYPDMPNFVLENGKAKLFAGWLIEKAGWKGRRYKNVMVSPKHALIIINPENKGKASEVAELAELMRKDVEEKFGIKLEREVGFVNV